MKIGFDAKRLFSNMSGLGNYSRTLVQNLNRFYPENEYYLFATKTPENRRTEPFLQKSYSIIQPQNWLNGILWRSLSIKTSIANNNLDIYHGLSAELPVNLKQPSVVTIHDLIFETHPQQYSTIDQRIYHLKAKNACATATKVIAISHSTKNDLIRLYNIDPQKIKVIYQTCDEQFFQPISVEEERSVQRKYSLPDSYLLYVGSIIERKNLFEIVKAVRDLKNKHLVVVGDKTSAYAKKVMNYISENQLEDRIHFPEVDFSDLPCVYKSATIFLYPSEYEGFGIPVIESLAVGTPVITSAFSSLPEAAGPHSVLLNDLSSSSIKSSISELLSDKEKMKRMSRLGKEYVQQFDAKYLSEQLQNLYESIV